MKSQLIIESARAVAKALALPTVGLRGQLQQLAQVLCESTGLIGTAVVVLDEEGEPLVAGAHGIEIAEEPSELHALSRFRQELGARLGQKAWVETKTPLLRIRPGGTLWTLPVLENSCAIGTVLVAARKTSDVAEVLEAVSATQPIVVTAIRAFLQQHAWRRVEELQKLAHVTVERQPWDFQALVDRLAELSEAGAVTLLLREHGELRLAASTDRSLRRQGVVYRSNEGLTGHIFATGKALRIADTKDREEIFRATGLVRPGPLFPERDREGTFPHQFLGVPLRFGATGVGVLRFSRRQGTARFTLEDEKAFQFFADLLGAALAPAWDLLLRESILETTTEAIAVSRRSEQGHGQPAHWQILQANPGTEQLLGLSLAEIEGMDPSALYAPGEYEVIRNQLLPVLHEARRKDHAEHGPVETRMKRADGTIVPVTISYRLLTNALVDPPTVYTLGIARDISGSERQAAQHRRLLKLLDAAGIAYFQANADGITTESTPIDERITGYSRRELDTLPRTILYFESDERERLLKRARAHGGILRDVIQMRRKNGDSFYAEGDIRILRDHLGREVGSEGLYRDVTDRIQLQGFINAEVGRVLDNDELFLQLKRNAAFQLDYLSSLSHQLLTPLDALIETLRNFEEGVLSHEGLARRLPYAIGQAIVCTRLVRNLSYMDKVLRNEPFERERVQMRKLAIETKFDFQHLLHERSLSLSIDEGLDRRVAVLGHPEMLRQVLINLVDNAIKYSFPHTVIHIRGRSRQNVGVLEISNQGLEIPVGERERVFERGYRSEHARQVIPHGTGLGLWLVRRILEAHGATIRCRVSNAGGRNRTVFRIDFPALYT